jgi:hypothetical protein
LRPSCAVLLWQDEHTRIAANYYMSGETILMGVAFLMQLHHARGGYHHLRHGHLFVTSEVIFIGPHTPYFIKIFNATFIVVLL